MADNEYRFRLGMERTQHGEPQPTIVINLTVHVSPDAPPALVKAVGEAIGELIRAGTSEEEQEKIARDFEEIRARKQRQADHAARLLVGEDVPVSADGDRSDEPEEDEPEEDEPEQEGVSHAV